jgi:hypothetical protein
MTVSGARGGLEDSPFTFKQSKDGRVFIHWRGTQALVLKGSKARAFLSRMSNQSLPEQQLEMARVTGNFKRGNER